MVSVVKLLMLLHVPVFPNLSIAYTLRVYVLSTNPIIVAEVLVVYDEAKISPPDITSYTYPLIPIHEPSVAPLREIFPVVALRYAQERGESKFT